MAKLIFYDIPTKTGVPWSPNTWKTRYALNAKKIDFDVQWIEYPDIEPTLKKAGGKPTDKKPDGRDHYTLPAIVTEDGEVISDSLKIALYLDQKYPNGPTLIPNGTLGVTAGFDFGFTAAIKQRETLFPLLMNKSLHFLTPGSFEYFKATKPIVDLPEDPKAVQKLWDALEANLATVDGWFAYTNEPNSPFLSGKELTFADIEIASRLVWIRQVWGADTKEWKQVLTWHNGRWKKLIDALNAYE